MKKESFVNKLGTFDTKTIVGIAIGAALYGVLMVYGGIKVFTNTSLSSAMLIDVIVGALFGPIPAMLTAFFGNVIADMIGAWGFWFDWSIGNGVLGLFVGLLPFYGARISDGVFDLKHAVIYVLCVLVGNAVAFGLVTPVLTSVFYASELTITWSQALTALVGNASVQIIIGLPLLFALASRNKKAMHLEKED